MWNQRSAFSSLAPSAIPTPTIGSDAQLVEKAESTEASHDNEPDSKDATELSTEAEKKTVKSSRRCGLGYWFLQKDDAEAARRSPSSRPIRLFAPVYGGIAVALSICES